MMRVQLNIEPKGALHSQINGSGHRRVLCFNGSSFYLRGFGGFLRLSELFPIPTDENFASYLVRLFYP